MAIHKVLSCFIIYFDVVLSRRTIFTLFKLMAVSIPMCAIIYCHAKNCSKERV